METVIDSSVVGERLKTICVAKRVQSSLATGNGNPVRPSSNELLPLAWSPQTTS